jgi:hypothetical protein
MAAGDRYKNGKPKDIVRHAKARVPITGEIKALCGNKNAGYLTFDDTDVTCLKCLKKI